ncbi:MAG: hypothetical protein V4505_12815 [Pseudomonadota bacterium]
MLDQKTDTHTACLVVLDRFMDALNAYDAGSMDATMHFPHVRFAGGRIKVYQQAGDNPMDLFDRLRAEDDWKYSTWRTRELVQFSDTKAHVALSYTRFRSDESVIGIYESLYVLTRVDGAWGIQMRSSFGP